MKRHTLVILFFPNEESCLRLIRALAVEIHEDWIEAHRVEYREYSARLISPSSAGEARFWRRSSELQLSDKQAS